MNENPVALEFDHENVVSRGQILTQTPMVICLVLNVGDQCMGNLYKDPSEAKQSSTNLKLRSMTKTQRSFDKAYRQNIRIFLGSLATFFILISAFSMYLILNTNVINIQNFELTITLYIQSGTIDIIAKGFGVFLVLLSSVPFSFSIIIDILVLIHTNFAEWDINLLPARIEFIYPHAALAFGKVAHMFMSRSAI